MKITIPPLPTNGLYAIQRTTLTHSGPALCAISNVRLTHSRRTARRIIGRAIRRDYWAPDITTLHPNILADLIRQTVKEAQ